MVLGGLVLLAGAGLGGHSALAPLHTTAAALATELVRAMAGTGALSLAVASCRGGCGRGT